MDKVTLHIEDGRVDPHTHTTEFQIVARESEDSGLILGTVTVKMDPFSVRDIKKVDPRLTEEYLVDRIRMKIG